MKYSDYAEKINSINSMSYVIDHTREEIRYVEELNGYVIDNDKFLVVQCNDDGLDSCIDMLAIHKFDGNKVICINGIATNEQLLKAKDNGIEVFDRKSIYEVMENERQITNGINIPALGTGPLKMHIINNIKNGVAQ